MSSTFKSEVFWENTNLSSTNLNKSSINTPNENNKMNRVSSAVSMKSLHRQDSKNNEDFFDSGYPHRLNRKNRNLNSVNLSNYKNRSYLNGESISNNKSHNMEQNVNKNLQNNINNNENYQPQQFTNHDKIENIKGVLIKEKLKNRELLYNQVSKSYTEMQKEDRNLNEKNKLQNKNQNEEFFFYKENRDHKVVRAKERQRSLENLANGLVHVEAHMDELKTNRSGNLFSKNKE